MSKEINNIIIKKDITKPKIRHNNMQLSDSKKEELGFSTQESIIDVEQAGYAISYRNDILHTYGIDPCCGLVLSDGNIRVLFHLDGTISPEEVIKITDKLGLSEDTKVIVIPGASCGIDGSFDYKTIEELYRDKGYDVTEQRIPATFGFVTVEPNKVTIGTGINRNMDITIPIENKHIDELEDLFVLKEEMSNENNYNKKKNK